MIFVIPKQHQKVLIEKANKLNGWISDWGKIVIDFCDSSSRRALKDYDMRSKHLVPTRVGELLIYVPNKVNLHVNGHLFR